MQINTHILLSYCTYHSILCAIVCNIVGRVIGEVLLVIGGEIAQLLVVRSYCTVIGGEVLLVLLLVLHSY